MLLQFAQFIADVHSSIQGGANGADASVITLTIQFQNFTRTNFVSPWWCRISVLQHVGILLWEIWKIVR